MDIDNTASIAIIGMSCRLPGAKNIEQFWSNLVKGVETISFFSEEELRENVDMSILHNPNYVKAGSILENIDWFDASFFGFSSKEAELTDPQQRIFLECVWEALEAAGYNPEKSGSPIGVYAGSSLSQYLLFNLVSNLDVARATKLLQNLIGNDKDYLATKVSYKLNLTGPSIVVQTTCSTSLVAVSLACQSLLSYQCDIAIAGGVTVRVPQKVGYLYEENGILSPDGHCRTFDAKAQGTISGSGAGVVILKRLEEAITDGDYIHAVIKGTAINNDGALKVGYTAPSMDGQAQVIAMAHAVAGIEAETVTYIEAHGTATPLGDSIEVAALTKVFQASTQQKGFCAIGSVKTNVGHLDAAAGITGLIKTVLALKHKLLPPSLHFEQSNPQIDLENSPFYVNTTLSEWKTNGIPRRAGVSSFGIGGTNAHVVLEEAPAVVQAINKMERPKHIFTLSARSEDALNSLVQSYQDFLTSHSQISLADVCFTANTGRKHFDHRLAIIAESTEQLRKQIEAVATASEIKLVMRRPDVSTHLPKIAFLSLVKALSILAWDANSTKLNPLFGKRLTLAMKFCVLI